MIPRINEWKELNKQEKKVNLILEKRNKWSEILTKCCQDEGYDNVGEMLQDLREDKDEKAMKAKNCFKKAKQIYKK